MRIISQDGKFDLPYEQCGMEILQKYKVIRCDMIPNGLSIMAYLQTGSRPFCMAYYTTEEKAIKAMEMLRDQHDYVEQCKYRGVAEIMPNHVFQFPKDDEGENV